MSELKIEKIEKIGDGRCFECGKDKPGVRFGLPFIGDTAFLCWEHFRLLQEAMKPRRVEIQRVTEIREVRSCGCCCHSCCCHRGRTYSRTYSIGHSQTCGVSESQSEGRSCGESIGISESCGVSRSENQGRSHSSGRTSSESQ